MAGKPPLPNGKIICQQPSGGAWPDDGQLWFCEGRGEEALGCPAQLAARMATSATTAARTRRVCDVVIGLSMAGLKGEAASSASPGEWAQCSQGAMGWKERISSVPGRTTPAEDSGTSFHAPGRSPSGSETTNLVSSPKVCRISTSGCS